MLCVCALFFPGSGHTLTRVAGGCLSFALLFGRNEAGWSGEAMRVGNLVLELGIKPI